MMHLIDPRQTPEETARRYLAPALPGASEALGVPEADLASAPLTADWACTDPARWAFTLDLGDGTVAVFAHAEAPPFALTFSHVELSD